MHGTVNPCSCLVSSSRRVHQTRILHIVDTLRQPSCTQFSNFLAQECGILTDRACLTPQPFSVSLKSCLICTNQNFWPVKTDRLVIIGTIPPDGRNAKTSLLNFRSIYSYYPSVFHIYKSNSALNGHDKVVVVIASAVYS